MRSHDAQVTPQILLNWKLEVAIVQVGVDVVLPPSEEGEDGVGGAGGRVLSTDGVIQRVEGCNESQLIK